jgi:HEPN domain-containing protein
MKPTVILSALPEHDESATFYSLASEFLEAATVLTNTPPTRLGYTVVTIYLAGHAAELLLKSILSTHGVDRKELKKIGHDLNELVKLARQNGLAPAAATKYIEHFSKVYKEKATEYRQIGQLDLPPLDLLLQEVRALQSHAFDHVAEFESMT